jgi:hypothetical protein
MLILKFESIWVRTYNSESIYQEACRPLPPKAVKVFKLTQPTAGNYCLNDINLYYFKFSGRNPFLLYKIVMTC